MNEPRLTKEQEERFDDMNRRCDGAFGTGKFPPEVKSHLAQEIHAATLAERERILGVIEGLKLPNCEKHNGMCFEQKEILAYNASLSDLLQQINE